MQAILRKNCKMLVICYNRQIKTSKFFCIMNSTNSIRVTNFCVTIEWGRVKNIYFHFWKRLSIFCLAQNTFKNIFFRFTCFWRYSTPVEISPLFLISVFRFSYRTPWKSERFLFGFCGVIFFFDFMVSICLDSTFSFKSNS